MEQNSPMDTVAANAMAMGDENTSYRDMIGDNTNGAMGTHIGNRQDLAANAKSDYNRSYMSEVQINNKMIDATRGYGQDSGIYDHGSSIFNEGPSNHGNHGSSIFDNISPHVPSSASHNMPSNLGSSLYSNNSPHTNNFNPSSHNIPSDLSSSLYDISASSRMSRPSLSSEPEYSKKPSYLMAKKQINNVVYIDRSLTDKTNNIPDVNTRQSEQSDNIETTAVPTKEEKKEEITEKPKPSNNKSSSNVILRPVEASKKFQKTRVNKNSAATKKENLNSKLYALTNDEFISLLEKTKNESESTDPDRRVVVSCKMALLKKEAIRRHSAVKNI